MTFLLPLVAFALAVAAPFVLQSERGKLDLWRIGALLVLLLAVGEMVLRSAPEIDRTSALIGLALGALSCVGGRWSGGLGFGVAAAAALHLLPATSLPVAGMALAAGTALGALTAGGESSAIAAVLVVAADNLGMRHSQIPAGAFVGSQVGVALTVASLFPHFKHESAKILRVPGVAAVALLAYAFLPHGTEFQSLGLCLALGSISAVVIHVLMPSDESEPSRVGLAAVIGIGLATVAFSLEKGVGMAVALLTASGILLALGNHRAVLALGPAVGLVIYRVLREAGTGATRALDISQHYTLLALVFGLTLPLLPVDWLKTRAKVHAIGSVAWGLVMIATPPLVVIALGMRGGIGLIIGLGVAGLVEALKAPSNEKPLSPLAIGAGMAGATVLTLTWLGEESALSRDEKVRLFGYVAVGIVIVASLLGFVGRTKKEAVTS
jgi:hypothetical protein